MPRPASIRAKWFSLPVLALAAMAARPAPAAERPNILVILADDMGWSDTSPYGSEIVTPNIAALAARGVTFTNFHVAAYCSPTRSMLMTGADNHTVGFGNMTELAADNQRGQPGYEGSLNGRAATIATTLRGAGYHTYMAGKWHLGKTPETMPAGQGFEDSVGLLEGGADNWEAKSYSPGYKAVHFFEGTKPLELPKDFYSSQYYTDRMMRFIDAHAGDGKPFFGFLAYQAVHQPHQAPADFTARYISTYQAGWPAIARFRYDRQVERGLMPPGLALWQMPGLPGWDSLGADERRMEAKRMAVYAGMVEYMDLSIGRLLDHLKQRGMLDNTVVVFASDNGGEASQLVPMFKDYYAKNFDMSYEHLGEKGSYSEYGPGWASVSMTPFANFKGSAAEGGVRAPFIIRYPAAVPQGVRTNAFAFVTDVVPTLLSFAGVDAAASKGLTGTSMVPMLTGAATRVHPEGEAIGYEAAGGAALYQRDWKLVRSVPPYGDRQWRLYDLHQDPTETRDLSGANPELARSMKAAYEAYVVRQGVVEVPPGYDVMVQGRANAGIQK